MANSTSVHQTVEIALENDIELLLPLGSLDKVTARYTFISPVEAPIRADQKIGELIIMIPDSEPQSFPLTALTSVEAGGFVERIFAATEILLRRVRATTSGD